MIKNTVKYAVTTCHGVQEVETKEEAKQLVREYKQFGGAHVYTFTYCQCCGKRINFATEEDTLCLSCDIDSSVEGDVENV